MLGNGGAVHLDELCLRSRAVPVDDAGDQALACSRLAGDQKGRQPPYLRLTREERPEFLPKRGHRRALTDQFVAEVHGAPIIGRLAVESQTLPDTPGGEPRWRLSRRVYRGLSVENREIASSSVAESCRARVSKVIPAVMNARARVCRSPNRLAT